MTLNEELARVEDVNVNLISMIFTLLVAVTIAMGLKVIGALLISSLLIIPAAAARQLAKSPESMVFWSMLIGIMAVLMGMTASWFLDLPAGPSIVVSASVIFLVLQFAPQPRA